MAAIIVISLFICIALPGAAQTAASGTVLDVNGQGVSGAYILLFDAEAQVVGYAITDPEGGFSLLSPEDDQPLPDATVDALDGFIIVQPEATVGPPPDQLGIYQHQPRVYRKPPDTPLNMVLPQTACIVLKGYDHEDDSLMRWGDYVSGGPGNEGAQFFYLTNMDEETQPAVPWPVYDDWARQPPQNASREYGLPSLAVDVRKTEGRFAVNLMYWDVEEYGKLLLRADNAGVGFELPSEQGGSLVIDVNLELARTAVSDLHRRRSFYEENITDEDIGELIADVEALPDVDERLSEALQLRDRLELRAAQNTLEDVRKGSLEVTARDVNMKPVKGCTVTINQVSHDFMFGGNGGTPFEQQQPVWQKAKDAGFELAPLLPAWGFTENPEPPYQYMGRDYVEGVFGVTELKEMGFKVKFTGSVWMQKAFGILPPRTEGMTLQEIRDENIQNQDYLLEDFKDDIAVWEVMNEPAATNTVVMPRPDMAQLMNTSATHIKAANGAIDTLVNSPPEFDFGLRYQHYRLEPNGGDDNKDLDGYSTTYSDFLKRARTILGNLDSIDTVGIQFYPGCHVSEEYGSGEAPAMTPSWLVDTVERYNALFEKPVHITELSFPADYDAGTWHSGYWRQQWDENTQADYAESVYTMMFANPNVHSVLWWDMCDTGAFVESGGLVRPDYSEKPSYTRIKGLIDDWTSSDVQGITDEAGGTVLSGFGGEYEVAVEAPDGMTVETTAHICERRDNELVVGGFNPVPTIDEDGLVPDSEFAGGPGFTLTVNGAGFVPDSTVRWNGEDRSTTYISDTRLEAEIPAADITSAGTAAVTVFKPNGLESGERTFTINPSEPEPVEPSVLSVRPTYGPPGTTVTITGVNFGSSRGSTARMAAGSSYVVFNGVKAAEYPGWSDTEIKAIVPDGASSGRVEVMTPSGVSTENKLFKVCLPVWYLAEGTSDWGFDTYLNIQNPNDDELTASVTYMTGEGPVERPDITLPAGSQTTINPRNDIGEEDFSTCVECKQEGKTIAVDRRMIWNGEGAPSPEGHASVGVTSPSETWYLPEGSSRWGFETWLMVQNPNDEAARVTLTYMIEGAGPVQQQKTVPASSRATFSMSEDVGQVDASAKVESNLPVIAERAMYRNNRREGHGSIGATAPAADYYLAEGTTDWGFTTYVLIQNPNNSAASVDLTYMTSSGPVSHPENPVSMPANSRKTIRVNDFLPGEDFSTRVSADKPVIAERAMYWGEGTLLGEACHDSIGLPAAHQTFYFPDGETQGGHETWTLVANPNSEEVEIRIIYMTPDGTGNQTLVDILEANSRKTYNMADAIPSGRASVLVTCTSGNKIIAERAMYWNSRGAGTDTTGGYSD